MPALNNSYYLCLLVVLTSSQEGEGASMLSGEGVSMEAPESVGRRRGWGDLPTNTSTTHVHTVCQLVESIFFKKFFSTYCVGDWRSTRDTMLTASGCVFLLKMLPVSKHMLARWS